MSKIFYDHLILIEEITSQFNHLDVDQRQELEELVDQTFHHHVLDVILTNFPKEHHKDFLTRFHVAPHDEALMSYLEECIDTDIKAEIQKVAQKLKKDLLSEIKKSKLKAS